MVEMLGPIWRRVLQLSSVGVDDNFFYVGGDAALARSLFEEIASACGRELPPVMICQAPTIAKLAALLEQPTTPSVPALLPLKPGSDWPPVFMAHGLGGSVIDLLPIVKHIPTAHAIHGVQAKGIEGVEKPFDRVEDMARYSLEAVKQLQPHGPYFFVGYSLGGLVMLEMARQLIADGEKVGLLAMMDSYPEIRYLPLAQRVRLVTRLATRRVATATKLSPASALSLMVRPSWRRALLSGTPYLPPPTGPLSPTLQRVREGAYLALTHYQPRFYPGKIKFVRAAIVTDFPADAAAVWAPLASEVGVETVPGDHLGMITAHYENLASVLSRYLEEAFIGSALS
jgi:thioesterase domain-containing protein